jgi:hypothetical protein
VIPAPYSPALAVTRGARRLGVLVLCLALLGGVGFTAFAGLAWVVSNTSGFGGGACGGGSGSTSRTLGGDAPVSEEQRRNAAVIVAVGKQMQVPDRGLWVALATAMQESTLRNINYGDRDSLGLFQQRPSQGWGSPAQVTDPGYAATRFYERLLLVPGWEQMPLWEAAQTVQRSAFPTAYSKWEELAGQLLVEVGDGVSLAGTDLCPPPGSDGDGPVPAPWTGGSTGCVRADPTSDGCLTGATLHALEQIEAAFGGYRASSALLYTGCWSQRPWNPTSDHPAGRGCDLFPGSAGNFAKGDELGSGWRVARWLRTHADALQVSYIIWQGRIWTAGSRDDGGWGRAYTGGGVYDAREATGGHYDHIHVSFRQ